MHSQHTKPNAIYSDLGSMHVIGHQRKRDEAYIITGIRRYAYFLHTTYATSICVDSIINGITTQSIIPTHFTLDGKRNKFED